MKNRIQNGRANKLIIITYIRKIYQETSTKKKIQEMNNKIRNVKNK